MTLPAVCIEGGTITLFITILENGMMYRTRAEERKMIVFFAIYSTLMISRSFLTIGDIISVDAHIMTSRIMAGVVIIVTGYALYLINKPSPRMWI